MLLAHSWDLMGLWGSKGLYGAQAIESWHVFYNQNAPRLTAETALLSCRKLVQMMVLIGVPSEVLRRAKAPVHKRKAAPRGALRPGDRSLRERKTWRRECFATLQKRIDNRAKRAKDQFEKENGVIRQEIDFFLLRVAFLTGGPLGVILGPGLPPGGLVGRPMSCEPKADQQPGFPL